MKFLILVLDNANSKKITKLLLSKNLRATKLVSSGGVLSRANTTLLIGVEDERVDEIISLIEKETIKNNKNTKEDRSKIHIFSMPMQEYIKI